MRIAFKKYSQNPQNDTGMSNYPWVSAEIEDDEEGHYLESNWAVMSRDAYNEYMSRHSNEIVTYNTHLNNTQLRIFDLVHNDFRFNDPSKIDFTIHLKNGVLLKKETEMIKNGRPLIARYYHPTTNDMVAEIKFVFIDNAYKFMAQREEWLGYYNHAGIITEYYLIHKRTYDFTKLDQATESMQERVTARNTIIQGLKIVINSFLVQYHVAQGNSVSTSAAKAIVTGGTFFNNYRNNISDFIEVASGSFKTNVLADTTFPWLDNPIAPGVSVRAYIVDRITY